MLLPQHQILPAESRAHVCDDAAHTCPARHAAVGSSSSQQQQQQQQQQEEAVGRIRKTNMPVTAVSAAAIPPPPQHAHLRELSLQRGGKQAGDVLGAVGVSAGDPAARVTASTARA